MSLQCSYFLKNINPLHFSKSMKTPPLSSLMWSYLFGILWGIGGLTFIRQKRDAFLIGPSESA